ncbi:MAG: hypothetical protein H8D45_17445 [Bacteroidetes bacterium]|nr:hypothetical protein [Bacteroidota bacterium]
MLSAKDSLLNGNDKIITFIINIKRIYFKELFQSSFEKLKTISLTYSSRREEKHSLL